MKVIIDDRERNLYSICDSIVGSNMTYLQLSKETLTLGDVYITTDEDKPVVLIERKSLQDLLASIKDGRYEEQSYRLMNSSGFPPHSIIYIIEGMFSELRTFTEKKIVYSALTSLNYFKGFSVIRTCNTRETAEYIVWMAEKIERNFLKSIFPYYLQPQFCKFMQKPVVTIPEDSISVDDPFPPMEPKLITSGINTQAEITVLETTLTNQLREPDGAETTFRPLTPADYCSVVKKVKKDNITPENIGEIILCQIPGISSVSAIAIMKRFSGFPNLISELHTNPTCLDAITIETNGKTRKINKTIIENIKRFLL
jgi:ERCC4-type nuclease